MDKVAKRHMDGLNKYFKKKGILSIDVVDPKCLIPQKKNARYFIPEIYEQLVKNIKEAGMESTPLVTPHIDPNKYWILSGHHRIEAAIEAHIDEVIVMVVPELTRDEEKSKQLSRNSLVGEDDQVTLMELFQEIRDMDAKMATGLSDMAGKISYDSLSFRVGTFKEFTIMFIPQNIDVYDETTEELIKMSLVKSSNVVRMAGKEHFDDFAKLMRKFKKVENIKSNGIAFGMLIQYARERMDQIKENGVLHGGL